MEDSKATAQEKYAITHLEGMNDDELKSLYIQMFDSEPHHNKKRKHLIRDLSGDETYNPKEETEDKSEKQKPKDNVLQNSPSTKFKSRNDEGIVLIELIDPKRTASLKVRPYTDEDGNVRRLKEKGGRPWEPLITKNLRLDMANEDDRALYEHLKDHPVYVKSNWPALKIVNEYQDAIDDVERSERAITAKNIIMKLGERELRDFAKILGVNAQDNVSIIVVKHKVYDLCDESPEKVIQMWENPQKDLHILVTNAIDTGILKKEGVVFKYQQVAMGASVDEIILYLSNNSEIISSINHELQRNRN